MRTTLIIDDDVADAARHRAIEEGITLGELVTRALRAALRADAAPPEPPFAMVTWGEARPGRHLTPEDIHRALEDEDLQRLGRS